MGDSQWPSVCATGPFCKFPVSIRDLGRVHWVYKCVFVRFACDKWKDRSHAKRIILIVQNLKLFLEGDDDHVLKLSGCKHATRSSPQTD